jgi:phosphohistidine phosphatase
MLVYLLRHADAATQAETDDARALSDKGQEQARKVARFCEAHDIRPAMLLTSPLRRAHQTAMAVSELLGSELFIVRWLACGMAPAAALSELGEYAKFPSVMLVGHEPDFSAFAAHGLGIPSHSGLHVRKASLTLLEFFSLRAGGATLQFSVPCKLM